MKITSEMLFFLLSGKYTLKTKHIGRAQLPIRRILPWREDDALQDDVLYLVMEMGTPCKDLQRKPGNLLFCSHPDEASPEFLPEDNGAVLCTEMETTNFALSVLELYQRLTQWDARFLEAILYRKDYREAMAMGMELLPWKYAVIDLDMRLLYATPDYIKSVSKNPERVPKDNIEMLLMSPEFHEAVQYQEAFYYYEEYNSENLLCYNLKQNGQYFARLCMHVGGKDSEVPLGARELFEAFAVHLEDLIRFDTHALSGRFRDQMHRLFQSLAVGETPEPGFASAILKKFGWKDQDAYTVFKLLFYEEEGWKTQLEITLPFLAQELENQWQHSCAVVEGSAILWIINQNLSKTDVSSHDFRQQVASFVRDHVCSAGQSSSFDDFSKIPFAVREAEVALQIGQRKNPQFWFFLFDDYRLEYMLGRTKEELPFSMLCHPAITQLIAYDQEHGTELSETLRVYLQSHMNMTAAAERIYVHRTTFCRRMNHIHSLTGLDLEDPDTILDLMLSYRLSDD
ncbi:MAG: helix-turn-helix domain-containing protein [Lachnospiraceae bacterium]|nr:helix-turn-helix domain-containing protein [Lachnospiraceae bacterium]